MVTRLPDTAPVPGSPSRQARRTPTRANIQVTVALAPWSTELGALLSPFTYTVTSAGLESLAWAAIPAARIAAISMEVFMPSLCVGETGTSMLNGCAADDFLCAAPPRLTGLIVEILPGFSSVKLWLLWG